MKKLLLCVFLLPGAALLFAQQSGADGSAAGEPSLETESVQGGQAPALAPSVPPVTAPVTPAAAPAAVPQAATVPQATEAPALENPQERREQAAAQRPAQQAAAEQDEDEDEDIPPPPGYAQSPAEDGEYPESEEFSGETESAVYEEEPAPKKQGFRFKNRMVELEINAAVDVSNNAVTAVDILQEVAQVDLDNFLNGFKLDFGAIINPFLLKFNWKDRWGFGLGVNVTAVGNAALSENILTLQPASNDEFGVGAAVFADFAIPVFFHVGDFKVKFRPAAFLPVAYTEPGISYTRRPSSHTDANGQTLTGELISVDYDMHVYTPVSLAGIEDGSLDVNSLLQNFDFTALGYDFGLGVEYPLYSWLDVGADISNFPLVFASLNHYMHLQGRAWLDSSYINLADLVDGKDMDENAYGYPEEFEPVYGEKTMRVYRPFKMLFYADYRPFESRILSLIPALGFSINPLYVQKGSIEGGVSARCDLANILITTIGINYFDRMWRNSLDLAINLRAFELDIGVGSQSQDFLKSWQGAGVFVKFGIKLGW